ncbi:histone modifying enzyme [Lithospermum erythrorhizon]|uniref:histone deacetylase n=1 Tax=Lithospermum erythrorhizon TaxID=34254 RepID=A0AAV3QZU4_LITER
MSISTRNVLYISLHRHEGGSFYPGTGGACEVGKKYAKGFTVNIPWKCRDVGDNDYIFAFQTVVLPIASQFDPDFTIVSAGFDAPRDCDVSPAGYAQMTAMLKTFSSGKMLVILEGGSNLRWISSSISEVFKVLIGDCPRNNMDNVLPSKHAMETIEMFSNNKPISGI